MEATMRAAMSVEPPAGNATISWMGRFGKSCADAAAALRANAVAMPAMSVAKRDMVSFLLRCLSSIVGCLAHLGWSQSERRAQQHQAGNDEQPETQGTRIEYREIAGRHLERGAQRFFQERPEDQAEHQRRGRQIDLAHAVADDATYDHDADVEYVLLQAVGADDAEQQRADANVLIGQVQQASPQANQWQIEDQQQDIAEEEAGDDRPDEVGT